MYANTYHQTGAPPPTYMAYPMPNYGVYTTPPKDARRHHSRRASEGPTAAYHYYASPPPPPAYSTPQQPYAAAYATPDYYATKYATPRGQHTADYVSPNNDKYTYRASVRSKTSRFAADQDGFKQQRRPAPPPSQPRASRGSKQPGYASSRSFAQKSQHCNYEPAAFGEDGSDDDSDAAEQQDYAADEYYNNYYHYGYTSPEGSPPPPYHAAEYHNYYYGTNTYTPGAAQQDKTYSSRHQADTPPAYRSSTRPRANTFTSSHQRREQQQPQHHHHHYPPNSTPSKPSKSSSSKRQSGGYTASQQQQSPPSPPKATAADALRAGIPAGYSYKNWDPTEEPIYLLGSVFDANSLGKWVYDWTVFHHGPATPMADMAGDLWLLLIQLSGKMKRAEERLPRIRLQEDRELVDDFIESGERLWSRLAKILKTCEDYMWREAKKENGGKKTVAMGARSGCEFVDSIFGRTRKLLDTEKLMTGMRLWSMRFDANCEDILRNPSG